MKNYDPSKYHNMLKATDKLLHVGVDLDGTLAEAVWPELGIGKPIAKTVDYIRDLSKKGYKIIIFTARGSSEYKDIEAWLNDNDIPFKWIHTGKPLMAAYIDDRNVILPWLNRIVL